MREQAQDFGTRLTNARKVIGLTQQELADRVGATRRMIAYYERESAKPPSGMLTELARALRLTADELLGLAPLPDKPRKQGAYTARAAVAARNVRDELPHSPAATDLLHRAGSNRYGTVLADPPWRFQNRTGKVAPEHRRLNRYGTMTLEEIMELPVGDVAAEPAHLYLWVPNALLLEGLQVLTAWGFTYKSNLVWHKVRKDGGPDGRGVGFYFRNTTELVLFGVRGKNARTLAPGRRQVNILRTEKREHSRKPDELYDIIQQCSRGPFLELFARGSRPGWTTWGNQADDYTPTWDTYANHSQAKRQRAERDLFTEG